MLLSYKRLVVVVCLTTTFCLGFMIASLDTTRNSLTNLVPKTSSILPFWTTEQLQPRFAYVQYATDLDYLCNAVINFSRLKRFAVQYDMLLIYPIDWEDPKIATGEYAALKAFRLNYPEVHLRPFKLLVTNHGDSTWSKSLTKLHAFGLTDYTRVLAFDSDSLVLNNMDHYFLAPLAPVAVPRAYWLYDKDATIKEQILGSHVMLLEPSDQIYKRVVEDAISSGDFDMEIINHLFRDSAMILPHRRLAMLTGELRASNHSAYMAEDRDEEWNAMAEISRAYLIHFSDWPLPKPWKPRTQAQWEAALPICTEDDIETPDKPACADRSLWTGIYEDYDYERKSKCKIIQR